jgi:hypothetical protein
MRSARGKTIIGFKIFEERWKLEVGSWTLNVTGEATERVGLPIQTAW